MPSRSIKLTERMNKFVDKQVDEGRFRNASEVLLAGLRLLEEHTQEEQQKLELLRSLAKEGFDQLDQGKGIELNGKRELRAFIQKISRRAAANVKRR